MSTFNLDFLSKWAFFHSASPIRWFQRKCSWTKKLYLPLGYLGNILVYSDLRKPCSKEASLPWVQFVLKLWDTSVPEYLKSTFWKQCLYIQDNPGEHSAALRDEVSSPRNQNICESVETAHIFQLQIWLFCQDIILSVHSERSLLPSHAYSHQQQHSPAEIPRELKCPPILLQGLAQTYLQL